MTSNLRHFTEIGGLFELRSKCWALNYSKFVSIGNVKDMQLKCKMKLDTQREIERERKREIERHIYIKSE